MGLCQSHCWLGHSHHAHFAIALGVEVNHVVLFLVVERIDLETLYLTIDGATILHSDYHLIADLKFEVCHNFEVLIVITLFLISGAKFGNKNNICKKKAIKKKEKYNFNANYWVFLSIYPQIAISSDSKIEADGREGNET